MRWLRVAGGLAVVTQALAAQQTARPDAARAGSLEAEVHYTTGGDAWFSTNKPAYVALFDVSRGGVSQLYPTFSAQATELSGTSVRVEMRSAPPLPAAAAFGGSSLVTLNTPVAATNASGWPHTLLLVASTMPLRVGSTWDSNIAINNDLVRDHHWNELDTDAGIAAVVELVRPLGQGAELATDRVQLATPARYASSLAYDPTKIAVGYSCWDANTQFISPVPQLGANCIALREFPAAAPRNAAVNALPAGGAADTARTVSFRTAPARRAAPAASGAPQAPRISEQQHGDVRSISDPAAIRAFIESMKGGSSSQDSPRASESRGDLAHGQPRDQSRGDQPHGQPRDQSRDQGRDQPREARPMVEGSSARPPQPAGVRTDRPSTPPPAPPQPTKKPNERD